MVQSGDTLVLSLAELLGGKQVDTGVIDRALAELCSAFDFDGGLIYELDQYNHLHLKERCLRKELPLRGSFPIDAVDAAYRSYLAQETFVWLEGGQKNSAAENALLELFAAQSLVVASVVDETLQIYGLLVFVQQSARPVPPAGPIQATAVPPGRHAAAAEDSAVDVWPVYRGAGLSEQADFCQKFAGKHFG